MSDIKDVELPADDKVEANPEREDTKTEYIEFFGLDPRYGTEFHSEHSITRAHFKKYHDLTTPKDLVWTKGSNGRFLVPTADMTPEVAEVLAKDPAFKRVTV